MNILQDKTFRESLVQSGIASVLLFTLTFVPLKSSPFPYDNDLAWFGGLFLAVSSFLLLLPFSYAIKQQ